MLKWFSNLVRRQGIVQSGRPLFQERENAIYGLLPHLPAGLFLDVGAAAGRFGRLMLEQSPESEVIGFEPFPGNHPYWEQQLGGDSRARLIKAAVADTRTSARFYVSSTVSGSETSWETMVDYSSLGKIVADDWTAESGKILNVDTVAIDDVIDDRHVRLIKIDVQGGEFGVLKSAVRAIDAGRVDLLVIEFAGEVDVIDFLARRGYRFFDGEYLLIARPDANLEGWDIMRGGTLSTGRPYLYAWPVAEIPQDMIKYCGIFKKWRKAVGGVWTDLVCVRPGFLNTFMVAAKRARDANRRLALPV